jgi:hypothetical protein
VIGWRACHLLAYPYRGAADDGRQADGQAAPGCHSHAVRLARGRPGPRRQPGACGFRIGYYSAVRREPRKPAGESGEKIDSGRRGQPGPIWSSWPLQYATISFLLRSERLPLGQPTDNLIYRSDASELSEVAATVLVDAAPQLNQPEAICVGSDPRCAGRKSRSSPARRRLRWPPNDN